jgi:hypothetical protein
MAQAHLKDRVYPCHPFPGLAASEILYGKALEVLVFRDMQADFVSWQHWITQPARNQHCKEMETVSNLVLAVARPDCKLT